MNRKILNISFIFFSLILLTVCSSAQELPADPSLVTRLVIRGEFRKAREDQVLNAQLVAYFEGDILENSQDYPGFLISYYGGLKGLQAKFEKNPINMMRLLAQALRWMDQGVLRSPNDLEVRFVRFASLHQMPSVLGIGKKRHEDIDSIVRLLNIRDYVQIDRETQAEFIEFMLTSDRLTAEQINSLKSLVNP